jgi:NADH pyrophosphatase NudC (nudix superfamily)
MNDFLPAHERFHFCPQCGKQGGTATEHTFSCESCGFSLHFNATVSASALVVRSDGKMLFIRRARQPAQGMLAVPGGFVDPWERAEVALVRELQEEVGLSVDQVTFFCSSPNGYHYKGLIYPVCDLFFMACPSQEALILAKDEASEALWLDPKDVELDEIAFPSMRVALTIYREGLS